MFLFFLKLPITKQLPSISFLSPEPLRGVFGSSAGLQQALSNRAFVKDGKPRRIRLGSEPLQSVSIKPDHFKAANRNLPCNWMKLPCCRLYGNLLR